MKLPQQLTPALWGAVGGAALIAALGFTWFGWVSSSSAERMAQERADAALVTALTPVCLEKFRVSADATQNLAALQKIEYAWDQTTYVEKGGWATVPGTDKPNTAVARACAEALEKQTASAAK